MYMHKYIDSRYMFTYAFVCVYILYTILIYIAYFSVLFDTKRKAKENRKLSKSDKQRRSEENVIFN